MTQPKQISFDQYLDAVFDSPNWVDACVNMLAAFLESLEECRDDPGRELPRMGPPLIDQIAAVAHRAKRREDQFRVIAEKHGPEFQTSELGATLWWAGMAVHKAVGAAAGSREKLAERAAEDALFEIHALLFDTMSAISLLSVAEGMIEGMEAGIKGRERPN